MIATLMTAMGRRPAAAACAITLALSGVLVYGRPQSPGQSFQTLDSDYTQQLFGVTSSLAGPGGYLGGVAVLQNGNVLAVECAQNGTRLHRFSGSATTTVHGSTVHAETVQAIAGGCGMVVHPNGTLYLNMNDGVHGVANVDPTTGATIALMGPPGNALGIAVDPVTNHLLYAGYDCRAGVYGPTCTLYDVDPATGLVASTPIVFKPKDEIAYVDGMYFDPTGQYIFLDNRYPVERLTVLDRSGKIVQHVPVGSEPAGIGFHGGSDRFVVTNNTDGTMTMFRFPPKDSTTDDYQKPPDVAWFASGGFRGDLSQVGPDGCLYATQAGTRYNDYTETTENSIVQICGGFSPPPGITLVSPPPATGTLEGAVVDALTRAPIASANVRLSSAIVTATDSTGHYALSVMPGTYDATVTATNYVTATVSGIAVTAGDTTTRNFALTRIVADLRLTASAPATVTAGASFAYTFTATNAGPFPANSVVVSHVMPSSTAFGSISAPKGWTCTTPAVGSTGTISCAKASMASGETAPFSFTVAVTCPWTGGDAIGISAMINSSTPDPNPLDNVASIGTGVVIPPPVISGAAAGVTKLWPPNQQMIPVPVNYVAAGGCGGSVTTSLSVSSDEGSSADWKVVDSHLVKLRAAREGSKRDRTYTITITATDGMRTSTKTVQVIVPHDSR
jgi:uncharacterized repeat protein (TIGR01451 family)